ncbi:MAG: phosphatidate cytidylyltransferase [Oscillospiraceae bacterium]|jgi:phosphatidate cytidylyltransferase|nr:phosphatidate cytidylyltransferase [Oscillospiraceae bacterium]
MKVKVTAGIVGILLAVLAFWLLYTPLPVVIIAAFSGKAALELLKSLSVKSRRLRFLAAFLGAAIPFFAAYSSQLFNSDAKRFMPLIVVGFILLFFIIMLSDFKRITWAHVLTSLAGGLLIPLAFSALILIRDFVPYSSGAPLEITKQWPLFWMIYGLFCCWITDIFAYFTGRITGGKHKMSPNVSPNKSWEGAVGGVIMAVLFNGALWLAFSKCGWFGEVVPPLPLVLGLSPVLSVLGTLGDLTFSAIKRQTGIKDFGKFFPGHGGSLDRFDSYLFVMPAVWAVLWLVYGA